MRPDDYIPMRPIPITERLPKPYDSSVIGPQDCDPMGRCWWWSPDDKCWFWEPAQSDFVERCGADFLWLPHWTLPLPQDQPTQEMG